MSRRVFLISLLVLTAGALALRLPSLDARPMHTDEAVHAYKTEQLRRGTYRYDPADYHGPTLYAMARIEMACTGVDSWRQSSEADHRRIPVFFGAALVLLAGLLATALGRASVAWGAALLALSPAMVFYSRYFIQEMLFVFFGAQLLVIGYRWTRRPGFGLVVAAGAVAGLMHATKETAALSLASILIAALVVHRWRRRTKPETARDGPAIGMRYAIGHAAAALLIALLVAGAILGGSGDRPDALLDSFRAFTLQGRSGLHEHAWDYYFRLLAWSRYGDGPVWTEGLILGLAIVGIVAAFRGAVGRGDAWFARFLAIQTVTLAAIYAMIPHKTPWSILSVLFGLALLAGVGAAALLRGTANPLARALLALALVAGVAHLGWQAYRGAFVFAADSRNPYVYAHTVPDAVRLGKRVDALAALHPDGPNTRIDVIVPGADYWPLPWYLRRSNGDRIGYWNEVPADGEPAPIVIAGAAVSDALTAKLGDGYHASIFGLRPTVLLELRVERTLWERFLATRRTTRQQSKLTTQHGVSVRSRHRAMGTDFEIVMPTADRTYAEQAAGEAFDRLDRLESALSHYRSESEISTLNRAPPGTWVALSPETLACLQVARRFTDETGRAFDAGIGALLEATSTLPSIDACEAASMRHVELDADGLRARRTGAGVRIDLSGIGKGVAVDRIVESLREWGVIAGRVHGGHSSVFGFGASSGEGGWPIDLIDPADPKRTLLTLRLRDRAMGASGGARGGPIVDPRTGRPVSHHRATWVLAPTATEADALSTACMVWRAEEIARYCTAHPDIGVVVVTTDGDRLLRYGRIEPRAVDHGR